MPHLIDMVGKKFGKLTVISFNGYNADNKRLYICQCDCGNTVVKRGEYLRKGKELFCGEQHPTKICTICKKEKNKSEYHKSGYHKSGRSINPKCKVCMVDFYKNNRERIVAKYQADVKNPEIRKRLRINAKKSWLKNKHKELAYKRKYNKRPEVIDHRKNVHNKRKLTDLAYVIKRRLRWRVRDSLKKFTSWKKYKYASSIVLLGCDMEFLKAYIENKFTNGMSWDNITEWHIDHIKPCTKFDLTDYEEQKKCFHYSNLQPLWKRDNIVKGNKFNPREN